MREQLEAVRHRKYVGVAELAAAAAEILSGSGLIQARGTVSDVPDERTVRYYLSEGLLSPAEEKQGTASVFGYLHLVQLLVVKKLQSEHLPIRTIRELVNSRGERQLERLLGSETEARAKPGEKNDALRYLETLLKKSPTPSPPAPPPASPATRQARSTPTPPTRPSPLLAESTAAQASLPAAQSERETWQRVEIEPGLELHIRGSYRAPRETRGLRRLVQLILRTVEALAGKPGKRGS